MENTYLLYAMYANCIYHILLTWKFAFGNVRRYTCSKVHELEQFLVLPPRWYLAFSRETQYRPICHWPVWWSIALRIYNVICISSKLKKGAEPSYGPTSSQSGRRRGVWFPYLYLILIQCQGQYRECNYNITILYKSTKLFLLQWNL